MNPLFLIRALLRVYPAGWRQEYGEELELTVATRPLTFSIARDVLFCGLVERLRSAPVWQFAAVALALKFIIGTIVNSISPISPGVYRFFFTPDLLVWIAVGYLSVLRDRRSVLRAMAFSAWAATLGVVPELILGILWAANLVHPTILDMNGSPNLVGHGIVVLSIRSEMPASPALLLLAVPFSALPAGIMGLLGGGIAKMVSALGHALRKE